LPEERLLRIGREIFLAAFGVKLESIDAWAIDRLTSILEEWEVHPGQTLYTAGGPVDFIYFMEHGEVRCARDNGPSWTAKGRWVLGGYEAIGDRPATYTATAARYFRAMRVPSLDWMDMLEDSSQLAQSAVVNAARTVVQMEERIPMGAPASASEASTLPFSDPAGILSLVERLALLLDVRMLRLAGVQTVADLAAVSQQMSVASGDLVFERDAVHEHLIRIVEGEVVAECAARSTVRCYGPGDLICGAAILGGVAGPWQARALAPTRGIAVPVEAVFDMMEEHFDLVRSTFAALGARRELLLERLASESGDLVLT
jgi:CRP-like cAMP-binding protein